MIGIGVNIRPFLNKVARAAADYYNRITADGGVSESPDCVNSGMSDLDRQNLLNNASLLLIPSGYKGGKLYAEIPTNGNGDLTWTRGGDAFRTNASGVIQRVPWNLVGYSDDFTNSFWKVGGITTSVTANTTNAPNGTLTADTALVNSTYVYAGRAIVFQLNVGASYTLSLYVKKSSSSSADNIRISVNNTATWTGASTQKVALTNDWQRVTLTWTANGTQAYFIIGAVDNTGANDSTCYGNVDIWGAQLVEGTTAQTYLPTTDRLNFPRLSYMYGSCPSVLLEPQRTNLGTNSQNFADVSWAVLGGSTKGATNLTDPSNNNTACNVTWSAGAGTKYFYGTRTSATGTYTISFYIKSNSGSKFRLYDGVSGSISSDFTATSTFQRYSYTFTQSTGTGGFYGILSASDNSAGDIIVAFAQFEAGAYPTTYIPTTSATATRIADSFSRNNIYTNGLISASGGTWFVELRGNIGYVRDAGSTGLSLDASALVNGLAIRNTASGRLAIQKFISSTGTLLYTTTTDTTKIAIKWNGTSCDVFANGTKVVSASSFTLTVMENLSLTSGQVPYFIQQMALFPTPLSDTDCAAITSL